VKLKPKKETTGQLRITILNAPAEMSAPAFKAWFRSEAVRIQGLATRQTDLTLIRLFVPERARLKWTTREWDRLCQSVVDRHANIHRVEVHVVKDPLDMSQMMAAQAEAQADMREMLNGIESGQPPPDVPGPLH
jgi:hypothetical protein